MGKRRKTSRTKSGGRKSRPLNRSVVPVLGAVAALLIIGSYFAFHAYQAEKARLAYVALWESADRQFSRRAFAQSGERYQEIADLGPAENAGIDDPQAVAGLAQTLVDLCRSIENDDLAEMAEAFERLQSSAETLGFVSQDDGVLTRQQRLDELKQWTQDNIAGAVTELGQVGFPAPADLSGARDVLRQWVQEDVDRIRQSAERWKTHASVLGESPGAIRQAISLVDRQQDFVESLAKLLGQIDESLKTLDEDSLKSTRFAWEATQNEFPKLSSETLWADYNAKLREAFLNQLGNQTTAQETTKAIPGERIDRGPRQIERGSILVLPAGVDRVIDPGRLTFVKVHEHVYALDAADGSVAWAIETGHDAKWLPELISHQAAPLVHCVWLDVDRECISVLNAADGLPRWTVMLPKGLSFAGPPVVVGQSLHLLLADGSLWTLNVADGRQDSLVEIPEPTSSPMVVREDGKGVMVIGDKQGIYLIELSGQPMISEVIFSEREANALFTRGMWIPPFAIVFESELTDTCQMKVFREVDGKYALRQTETLAGRMWDDPAVVGADFLALTDAIEEMIWHIDLDAPVTPLSIQFQRTTEQAFPRRPHFLSHPDAPFLSTLGSTIKCYWIDSLTNLSNQQPQVRWEHSLPSQDSAVVQPLHVVDDHVIVASQALQRRRILVTALSIRSGDAVWSRELGGAVTSLRSDRDEAVLRTDSNHLVYLSSVSNGGNPGAAAKTPQTSAESSIRLTAIVEADSRKSNAIQRTVLPITSADDRFEWIPRASAIVRYDHSVGQIEVIGFDGRGLASTPMVTTPASPFGIRVGNARFNLAATKAEEPSMSVAGVWCAAVDAKSRLQLYRLGDAKQNPEVVYYQLEPPVRGDWYRPIWLADDTILFTHPSGVLARAKLKKNSDVLYLEVAEADRLQFATLLSDPFVSKQAIWVTLRSGEVIRIHRNALQDQTRAPLPAEPSTALIPLSMSDDGMAESDERVAIGLADGSMAVLLSTKSLAIEAVTKLSDQPLHMASRLGSIVCFADRGGKAYLIPADLSKNARELVVPPLAIPPVLIGSEPIFVTTNGRWRTFTEIRSAEAIH